LPNSPKTPTRTVRVPDDLWNEAKVKTAAEGTTITNVILAALRDYCAVPDNDAMALLHEVWANNESE
jgi:hypothetical protein